MKPTLVSFYSILPLLLAMSLPACGSDDTPTPKDDFGATPEAGLRASLDINGSVASVGVTLDNGDAADVYAPAIAAADRAKFVDRFPVVVLLQGALTPKEQYKSYAETFAGYGFVVIVPEHLRAVPPMFPNPVQLAEASVIPSALAAVEALDGDATSPMHQIADTKRSALTGHSQGGLTSLLSIAGQCLPGICTEPFTLPASIKAAALFGTHSVSKGSAIPVDTTGYPVALLQGSIDGRALPGNATLTYDTLEPTRALITFEGLNHFAITNDNVIPGTNQDPNKQTVEQSVGTRRVALWAALWLHAAFNGSPVAKHWLYTVFGTANAEVSVKSERQRGRTKIHNQYALISGKQRRFRLELAVFKSSLKTGQSQFVKI